MKSRLHHNYLNNLSKEGKMKLYHYRSISSALLEIENGTFHFASKEELNDPLEGFVRVFWQEIRWPGRDCSDIIYIA